MSPGPTDLEATAVPAHGKVGDTVKVRINANNLGPHITTVGEVVMRYIAPTGTELADDFASLPYCHIVTVGHEVWCYQPAQLWPAPSGTYQGFDLSITIDSPTVAPGLFRIECSCDTNLSNNSAKIVVTVDGVTATSAPGPHPSATPRPTQPAAPTLAVASATSIATPSASWTTTPTSEPVAIVSATSSPAPAVADASARSTGTNPLVGLVAAIAGCLAVIGVAIVGVVRRR